MGMKPILILGFAMLALFAATGVLVDELGVRAGVAIAVLGVSAVVGGVAVMLVEWGIRGETD